MIHLSHRPCDDHRQALLIAKVYGDDYSLYSNVLYMINCHAQSRQIIIRSFISHRTRLCRVGLRAPT